VFRVSDEYKKNPGAVEVISEQPGNPNHILIAYSRGLIVLWDRLNSVAVKVRENINSLFFYVNVFIKTDLRSLDFCITIYNVFVPFLLAICK